MLSVAQVKKDVEWEIKQESDWKVAIPKRLMDKIFLYAKEMGHLEIAGFMDVDVDKENKLYKISELRMFHQHASGAEVEFKSDNLATMLCDLVDQGVDISRIKGEWHSHNSMSCFWSKTDEECCNTLLKSSGDFYIFFVVNNMGEMLARIDYMVNIAGMDMHVTQLQIPVVMEVPEDSSLLDEVKADIATYVDRTPKTYTYGGSSYDSETTKRRNKEGHWDGRIGYWVKDGTDDEVWDWKLGDWKKMTEEEKKKLKKNGENGHNTQTHNTSTDTKGKELVPLTCSICNSRKKVKYVYFNNMYLCRACRKFYYDNKTGYREAMEADNEISVGEDGYIIKQED